MHMMMLMTMIMFMVMSVIMMMFTSMLWHIIWYMVYGIWCLVYGVRYIVYRVAYTVYGTWHTVYGTAALGACGCLLGRHVSIVIVACFVLLYLLAVSSSLVFMFIAHGFLYYLLRYVCRRLLGRPVHLVGLQDAGVRECLGRSPVLFASLYYCLTCSLQLLCISRIVCFVGCVLLLCLLVVVYLYHSFVCFMCTMCFVVRFACWLFI